MTFANNKQMIYGMEGEEHWPASDSIDRSLPQSNERCGRKDEPDLDYHALLPKGQKP